MCFSAGADVTLGLAVGVVGVDALRHVSRPAQLPLAALPLVLAAHQLDEAVVWWGLTDPAGASVTDAAASTYLVVAFVLLAVVPVAAARIEPGPRRRSAMWCLAAIGSAVSAVLLVALARGGPTVRAENWYIAYSVEVRHSGLLAVLYVLSTCGAFLVASDRRIVRAGAVNLAAVAVLAVLLMAGTISLWCAWAAAVSWLIASYLRSESLGEAATA